MPVFFVTPPPPPPPAPDYDVTIAVVTPSSVSYWNKDDEVAFFVVAFMIPLDNYAFFYCMQHIHGKQKVHKPRNYGYP